MPELAHTKLKHEAVLDERIFEEHDGDSKEDKADRFACEHLVEPTSKLSSLVMSQFTPLSVHSRYGLLLPSSERQHKTA